MARGPITDDDAAWLQTARDLIAKYDGDTERLVMELLISHEQQVQQVAYLQGEIERIAKAVPGLVTIRFEGGDKLRN